MGIRGSYYNLNIMILCGMYPWCVHIDLSKQMMYPWCAHIDLSKQMVYPWCVHIELSKQIMCPWCVHIDLSKQMVYPWCVHIELSKQIMCPWCVHIDLSKQIIYRFFWHFTWLQSIPVGGVSIGASAPYYLSNTLRSRPYPKLASVYLKNVSHSHSPIFVRSWISHWSG